MLVTIVTGGYHNRAQYQWSRSSDGDLAGEIFSILYVDRRGSYSCNCNIDGISLKITFNVREGIQLFAGYKQ